MAMAPDDEAGGQADRPQMVSSIPSPFVCRHHHDESHHRVIITLCLAAIHPLVVVVTV